MSCRTLPSSKDTRYSPKRRRGRWQKDGVSTLLTGLFWVVLFQPIPMNICLLFNLDRNFFLFSCQRRLFILCYRFSVQIQMQRHIASLLWQSAVVFSRDILGYAARMVINLHRWTLFLIFFSYSGKQIDRSAQPMNQSFDLSYSPVNLLQE